mmetsp:Transcript_18352/g.39975  ORF Transcript_18352/g.39975 Transcript_18352/m.39975 type:complete len:210 (-) Transcript_18352:1017-1646(-)
MESTTTNHGRPLRRHRPRSHCLRRGHCYGRGIGQHDRRRRPNQQFRLRGAGLRRQLFVQRTLSKQNETESGLPVGRDRADVDRVPPAIDERKDRGGALPAQGSILLQRKLRLDHEYLVSPQGFHAYGDSRILHPSQTARGRQSYHRILSGYKIQNRSDGSHRREQLYTLRRRVFGSEHLFQSTDRSRRGSTLGTTRKYHDESSLYQRFC